MRIVFVFILSLFCGSVFSQKMLLLERANRARTTKYYVGDALRFRLAGEEDYWYFRTLTDILPETNTLMLDNFAVKLPDFQHVSDLNPLFALLADQHLFQQNRLSFSSCRFQKIKPGG